MAKNNALAMWGSTFPDSNYYKCGLTWQLCQAAYTEMNGEWAEIDLVVAIITRAGRDRDFDWLHSDSCEYYCEMISINYYRTVKAIKNLCDYLDFGTGELNEINY